MDCLRSGLAPALLPQHRSVHSSGGRFFLIWSKRAVHCLRGRCTGRADVRGSTASDAVRRDEPTVLVLYGGCTAAGTALGALLEHFGEPSGADDHRCETYLNDDSDGRGHVDRGKGTREHYVRAVGEQRPPAERCDDSPWIRSDNRLRKQQHRKNPLIEIPAKSLPQGDRRVEVTTAKKLGYRCNDDERCNEQPVRAQPLCELFSAVQRLCLDYHTERKQVDCMRREGKF